MHLPKKGHPTRELVDAFQTIATNIMAESNQVRAVGELVKDHPKATWQERRRLFHGAFKAATLTKTAAWQNKNGPGAHTIAMMALAEAFDKHPLDPAYIDYTEQCARYFVGRLLEDDWVRQAAVDWLNWCDAQRIDLIGDILHFYADAFHDPVFPSAPMKWGGLVEMGEGIKAEYTSKGTMRYNALNYDIWRGDFFNVLGSVTHEATHHLHHLMKSVCSRLGTGQHVYFRQAASFAEIQTIVGKEIYIQPEEHYKAYHNHPRERDARRIQNLVKKLIQEARDGGWPRVAVRNVCPPKPFPWRLAA